MHNTCQKHLGMRLHEKLNFNQSINKKMAKERYWKEKYWYWKFANKERYWKLANVLPRLSLITIYKSFIRSHLIMGTSFMISLISNLFF